MNGKWTKENFIEHHKNNPEIYEMFVMFALKVAKVRSYYSAKNIFHRMRWETAIEERGGDFKIDDGWISHYARKFMDDFPDHADLFKTRTRINSYHGEKDAT
jgi:hypothetical protein